MDIKSAICMANNDKDTKHIRHISRTVHFVRNGEKSKMHNIDWWEAGLQLVEIATKNIGDNNSNPRMIYIMVRIDNW